MQEVQYCSIKRWFAKGLWYAPGTFLELYRVHGWYIYFYCAVLHLAALRKCRMFVHYYCSVEVFIKNCILPILLFFVNFTAHFACRIAYIFSLPILLNILLANFVKAYSSSLGKAKHISLALCLSPELPKSVRAAQVTNNTPTPSSGNCRYS